MMTKQEYEKNPNTYWEHPIGIGIPINLEEGKPLPLQKNPLWVNNIQQDIIINPGKDLCVDLGCGGGRYLGHTAEYFKQVIGVDFSSNNIARAKRYTDSIGIKNVLLYHTSLADMPDVMSDSVDFAYSVAVFMHMPDEIRKMSLQELRRILKPDGRAVLLEITSMEEGAFDCPNLTPLEWENMLINAGLDLDDKTGKELEGEFVRYKIHKGMQ
jgi:SAM-dependent methyltransferase